MAHSHDAREALMIGRRTDGSFVRRPLSPHLQVYDMLQMSSFTSILHRITGSAWAVGLCFFVWWLTALASGPEAYAWTQWFFGGVIGVIVLFGITVVGWYHTLAGMRHLAWDAGFGFQIPTMYRSGWAVFIGTGVMTVLTWIVAIIAWAS